MKEATGEKKPAQGGLSKHAKEELEGIAEKLRLWAASALTNASVNEPKGSYGCRLIEHGGMCYHNAWSLIRAFLDGYTPIPEPAGQTPVVAPIVTREMVSAGLRWSDSDDHAGAVKDVFEAMMKVVCTTPELRLAYLALLSESAQQGSATHPE